eukprot:scaffold53231_cov30-Tisochrysis_lutea.AAC.9
MLVAQLNAQLAQPADCATRAGECAAVGGISHEHAHTLEHAQLEVGRAHPPPVRRREEALGHEERKGSAKRLRHSVAVGEVVAARVKEKKVVKRGLLGRLLRFVLGQCAAQQRVQ